MNRPELPATAYLFMGYGLVPSFHIYDDEPDILDGNYLKATKKYFSPVTGVGIGERQGYSHQKIREHPHLHDI